MQRTLLSEHRTALQQRLLDHAPPSGGWPYYPGRASRIEPTCWAVLALSTVQTSAADALVARGRAFLAWLQRPDGLLAEPGIPAPNHAWNGLALFAGLSSGAGPAPERRLLDGVLRMRGIAIEPGDIVRQNNQLQAWAWLDGTFSWAEPTAYCLLGVKKSRDDRPLASIRIAEGEAVLIDRACDGGGWNYGNSQVLGQDLRPYVPTTALALVAMQTRPDHDVVRRGLEWLDAHALSERATMALAWAAIALAVFDRPSVGVREALADQVPATLALGNLHLAALALYALTIPDHGAREFRIG